MARYGETALNFYTNPVYGLQNVSHLRTKKDILYKNQVHKRTDADEVYLASFNLQLICKGEIDQARMRPN